MRGALTAALLSIAAGCAPAMVIPAEGTRLAWESCGQTAQGVVVMRGHGARCPDMLRVDERAKRVKAAFHGCSLDGVRVHVANAYVMCGEESVRGCTSGNEITVTDEVMTIPTISHEFAHVCISQLYGVDSLAHFRLDHPGSDALPRFTRDD